MLPLILTLALMPAAQQAPAPAQPTRTVEANVIAYDWSVRLRQPEDEFFERVVIRIGDPEGRQEKPELAQLIYAYNDLEKHRPPDYFFRRQAQLRIKLPVMPIDDPTCELPTTTTVAVEGENGEEHMVELSTITRNSGMKGEMPDITALPCYVIGPADLEILSHD